MSEKIHWSKLRVLLLDDDGITGPAGPLDTRIGLEDFYKDRNPRLPDYRCLARCGRPHETDDEKTWGPKSWDEVDWEGFEQAARNGWKALEVAYNDDFKFALERFLGEGRIHIDPDAVLAALDEHGLDGVEWHLVPKPKAVSAPK